MCVEHFCVSLFTCAYFPFISYINLHQLSCSWLSRKQCVYVASRRADKRSGVRNISIYMSRDFFTFLGMITLCDVAVIRWISSNYVLFWNSMDDPRDVQFLMFVRTNENTVNCNQLAVEYKLGYFETGIANQRELRISTILSIKSHSECQNELKWIQKSNRGMWLAEQWSRMAKEQFNKVQIKSQTHAKLLVKMTFRQKVNESIIQSIRINGCPITLIHNRFVRVRPYKFITRRIWWHLLFDERSIQ